MIKAIKNIKFMDIAMLFLIYFSFESAITYSKFSKEIVVFSGFFIVIFILGYKLLRRQVHVDRRALVIFLLFLAINLFNMFIYNDYAANNFICLSAIAAGFILCSCLSLNEFKKSFCNAMLFLCLYSLICTYLIMPLVMNGTLDIFPTRKNLLDVPFSDMFFCYGLKYFGLQRNYGIFREPGVYQIFIFIALIISFYGEKTKYVTFQKIIFILTMFTTFSSIGMMVSVLFLLIYYVPKMNKSIIKYSLLFISLIIGFMLLLKLVPDFAKIIENSLNKWMEEDNLSFVVRFESLLNTIKCSLLNPITGLSINNSIVYIINNLNTYTSGDVTGTSLLTFSSMGWGMGILVNYLLIQFVKLITCKNSMVYISIFALFFLSLNSQNIIDNNFFWLFCFIPFMQRENNIVVHSKTVYPGQINTVI